MPRPDPATGYPTSEVARLLDWSEQRVRSYVRAGFLSPRRGPGGAFRFSFQDLVILRAARGLREAKVPARRVKTALARLAEQLPRGRSLAAVAISAEGGQIVVREGGEAWEPVTGQGVLDFDFQVAELATKAAPLAPRVVEEARDRGGAYGADDWYELAWELEASSPEEARRAYERALELDPDHAEARLNLGRLHHEEGRLGEAEDHYRKAAEERPEDPTAQFNLGVVLQDLGRTEAAVQAYRRVLEIDAGYADAWYNLATLLEEVGKREEAFRSLKRYKELVEGRG
jgi:tetratricopeptide (TPR) repeat protein